ncbi:MAG: PEP-CTERM sorting domain-containing protein [Gemmatimonadaceae bacterium]
MRTTILAASLMLAAAPLAAQSSISIAPTGDPLNGFGKPSIATFGQTFTAPTGSVLQSFQFYLANDADDGGNGGFLNFRGYVMAWDAVNGHATGPVLFSSVARTGNPLDTYSTAFSTFGIPGGTTLNPGGAYVAFLSASGLAPTGNPAFAFENMEAGAAYAGGQWVYNDNGDDFASLSTTTWNNAFGDQDAAFNAQFTQAGVTTAPEPSELVLMVSGLSGLAGIVRLRRRRVVSA